MSCTKHQGALADAHCIQCLAERMIDSGEALVSHSNRIYKTKHSDRDAWRAVFECLKSKYSGAKQ